MPFIDALNLKRASWEPLSIKHALCSAFSYLPKLATNAQTIATNAQTIVHLCFASPEHNLLSKDALWSSAIPLTSELQPVGNNKVTSSSVQQHPPYTGDNIPLLICFVMQAFLAPCPTQPSVAITSFLTLSRHSKLSCHAPEFRAQPMRRRLLTPRRIAKQYPKAAADPGSVKAVDHQIQLMACDVVRFCSQF